MFNLGRAQSVALGITLLTSGMMLALLVNGYVDSEIISVAFYPLIIYLLLSGASALLRRFAVMQDPTLVQVRNVSEEYRRPPDMLTGTLRELERIGFWRAGELEIASPLDGPDTRWVLVHQERAIIAEVTAADVMPVVTYSTIFEDRSLVETVSPVGSSIHQADYWRQLYRDEPVVAFNQHWNNTLKFRARRVVTPVHLRSIDSVIRWRQIYQEQFYGRRLLYPVITNLAALICLLVVLIVFSINIYVDLEDLTLSLTARLTTDGLFLGGLAAYLFITWVGNQRDELA